MKKITFGIIVGFLVMGLVVAGSIIPTTEKDLVLTKDKSDLLKANDMDKFIYEDTEVKGDMCHFNICYDREVTLTNDEGVSSTAYDRDCIINAVYKCDEYTKEEVGEWYVNNYAQEMLDRENKVMLDDQITVNIR